MKIIMDPKSGYSEWTFDKKEIQAINKHGKLICEPQFIRHFSNALIKLVTDITVNKLLKQELKVNGLTVIMLDLDMAFQKK